MTMQLPIILATADDTIKGTNGNDSLTGDRFVVGSNDLIEGGNGDDTLKGFAGDDTLDGDSGTNELFGGSGDDVLKLTGTAGTFDGGDNNDTFEVNVNLTSGMIIGGNGTDLLRVLSADLTNLSILGIEMTEIVGLLRISADQADDLGTVRVPDGQATLRLTPGSGNTANLTLDLADGENLAINTQAFSSGSTVTVDLTGSTYAGVSGVSLRTNSADVRFIAAGGNDFLEGSGGDDTLRGGDGDDTIEGSRGENMLFGGAGNDRLVAQASSGSVNGGGNNDILVVSNFQNSTVIGGAGQDTLNPSGVLRGTTFAGIERTEIFTGLDVVVDAPQVENLGFITLAATRSQINLRIAANDGDAATPVGELLNGQRYDVDTLDLTDGDLFTIDFSNVVFLGDSAAFFDGSRADDHVIGGTGDDTLTGSLGNDTLNGGEGADTLIGENGDDTYIIDNAGDVINDNSSNTIETVFASINYRLRNALDNLTLTGSASDDLIGRGNNVDNIIIGDDGDNTLSGRGGEDTVSGGGGRDRISGNAGSDSLDGDGGNDSITGGSGRDTINGGLGSDTLNGGTGRDLLSGDEGNDVFRFNDAFGRDEITDFEVGSDRINLRDLRQENGGAPLDFEQLLITQSGANTLIRLDLDEDGIADTIDLDGDTIADNVSITLLGVIAGTLSETDFVL
ncbi:MAG: calcium-binding protein [Pseudomonadota bacterium]